ncbi:MAG: hypothetical protein LW703_13740 [Rhodobacter sp.]|nr:hypothetical protein [Rhodobacter sp.]
MTLIASIFQRHRFLVVDQRLGAPDRQNDHAVAVHGCHFAHLAVGQAGQIVVDVQLGHIPGLDQPVRGPAAHAVNRGFHHIGAAGLQRQLGLREHIVLARLFGEVHLDACGSLKGREHGFGKARIPGPAHEVHLARRGQRLVRNDRRRRQHAHAHGRSLKERAAAKARFRMFHDVVSLVVGQTRLSTSPAAASRSMAGQTASGFTQQPGDAGRMGAGARASQNREDGPVSTDRCTGRKASFGKEGLARISFLSRLRLSTLARIAQRRVPCF